MVGYEQDGLAGSAFPEILHPVLARLAALSGVDAVADLDNLRRGALGGCLSRVGREQGGFMTVRAR
jgi:hypothetical protein